MTKLKIFVILVVFILFTTIVLLAVYQFTSYQHIKLTHVKASPDDLKQIYRTISDNVSQPHTPSLLKVKAVDTTINKTALTHSVLVQDNSGLSFKVLLHDDRVLPWHNLTDVMQFKRRKYSVISTSTPTGDSIARYNYVFSVPLAILAWKRIGYGTIVLISGDRREWDRDPCLKVIKQYMNDLKAITVFLNVPDDNLIMLSQVSRIYAASILSEQLKEDDYLVTSDADLWPIDQVPYSLSQNKKILILNAGCCGSFKYKERLYHMVAMGNVGASVKTWREIITAEGDTLPKNGTDILNIFEKEFGPRARQRIVKGENEGWYLDQRMLTLLLSSWMSRNNISSVQFVPRNVGRDRVDRSWWSTDTIEGKIDVHVLENLHLTNNWLKVLPLFRLMFGSDEYSSLYSMTLLYFNDFNDAMAARTLK